MAATTDTGNMYTNNKPIKQLTFKETLEALDRVDYAIINASLSYEGQCKYTY